MGLSLGTASAAAASQESPPQDKPKDVTDLDLDDLVKVRVTSAARKEQALTDVPAAIYVIRNEDLKRSGVTSLAEALRAVPGLEVARPKANSWAVTARGFNSTSANKLLVLVDGRSVYSPLHAGVFWDVQDTFFEDIDRIEVIRGPGGAIWGANAINGVINIITKPAQNTQGVVVTGGAGTEERVFGGARYGFKVGDDAYVRAYVKYFNRDEAVRGLNNGQSAFDGLWLAKTGFRADWKAGEQDRLTVMGDFYEGESEATSNVPSLTAPFSSVLNESASLRGADFVFRWERTLDPTSELAVQAYYDYSSRLQSLFGYLLHTLDLDFQHRFRLFGDHEINWGFGYRAYWSDLHPSFFISATPNQDFNDIVSAFLQDEIPLVKDHLRLILGSKFEYNSFSGFEAQPSVRLAWTPSEVHNVWFAVSRAVRTPSSLDQDLRINAAVIPGSPPTELAVFGDPRFRSEVLLAFEAGYRLHPAEPISIDLATFYNRYDRLRSLEPGATFSESTPAPAHNVTPYFIENMVRAQTYGIELAASVQIASWWLVQANYTYLRMQVAPIAGSLDTSSAAQARQDPQNQVWVRSAMDLPEHLTLDVTGRFVDRLPAYQVLHYYELDIRLAWQDPDHHVEVAVVGQNLMHATHFEHSTVAQRSEIQRGVYASVTVRF